MTSPSPSVDPVRERITEIQQRADKATPGPWNWRGNVDNWSLRIEGRRPVEHDGETYMWHTTVMDFTRWGMRDAAPRFLNPDQPNFMQRATERLVFEVCPDAAERSDPRVYRGDISGIRHPDANFLTAARSDVPALLAALTAVLDACQRLEDWTSANNGDGDAMILTSSVRAAVAAGLGVTP